MPLHLAIAALMAALALWVLLANPRRELHRALAALLLLLAGSTVAYQLMREAFTPGDTAWLARVGGLYEMPAAFLILLLADRLFLPQPRTRARTAALALAGLATAAVMLAYLAQPPAGPAEIETSGRLLGDGRTRYTLAPNQLADGYTSALFLAEALVVALAAHFAADPRKPRLRRQQAALVGAAFGFLVAHTGGLALGQAIREALGLPNTIITPFPAMVACAAVAVAAVPFLPRGFDGRARTLVALALALPLAAGLFDSLLGAAEALGMPPLLLGYINSRSLWLVAFAVTLAVAILRYDLAAAPRAAQDRGRVAEAVLAGGLGLVAAGAALSALGTGPGGLAVAAVAVASPAGLRAAPLRGAAEALRAAVLLDPRDPDVLRERVQAYRGELAASLGPGGAVRPSEEPKLRELRGRLGLTERDDLLLRSVLGAGAQDGQGGHGADLVTYRVALEEAHAAGTLHAAADAQRLAQFRLALGVADAEHAALLADVERGGRPAVEPGEVLLGRWRIVRRLGRGGFGEVWLASDLAGGGEAVLKRLDPALQPGPAAFRQFLREMRVAGAFRHPRIVQVEDMVMVRGEAFLVMEHLAGGSLADAIAARGKLPEAEVARIGLDVLDALAAVHARGVVHRDVKPGNVLLEPDGRAKLGDFSVAKELVSGATLGPGAAPVAGTPAYMAPEQARGLPATAATDLYGLAATLHHALAGRPPVDVAGLSEFEARLRVVEHRSPQRPAEASPALAAVLARALAQAPEDRYPSAEAMAAALAGAAELRREGH